MPMGGDATRSSLGPSGRWRACAVPFGFVGEITEPPAELEVFGQGKPAPLHVQKILLQPWIGLSGGFARAFLGVFVAFANLFAQTLKHRTYCSLARARLALSKRHEP